MMQDLTIYIFDTNELTNLRAHDDLEQFWSGFVDLVKNGRIKTVPQVICELDQFPVVAKAYRPLRGFMRIGAEDQYAAEVTEKMIEIEKASPKLIDYLSRGNCDPADPWLIAIALVRGYTIVTAEKSEGNGVTTKIPFVCKSFRPVVKCINLNTFLNETELR